MLAMLLGFNLNVLFSAVLYLRYLQLDTPVKIGNFVLALVVVAIQLGFTIGMFRWSKQLNREYVHPLDEMSKATTIENDKPPRNLLMEVIEAESAGGVVKEESSNPPSPTKPASREFDRDSELVLKYDLSSLFRGESKAANYYNSFSQLRNVVLVVLVAVMQEQPLAKMIILLIANSAYFAYTLAVRPFESSLNNVRLLALESAL